MLFASWLSPEFKLYLIKEFERLKVDEAYLARYSNPENPSNVIIHWMSNKTTFNYIGLWEQINNRYFNFTRFSEIKTNEVGLQSFTKISIKYMIIILIYIIYIEKSRFVCQ